MPSFRRGAFALFALTLVVTLLLGDRPFADRLALEVDELLVGRTVWAPLSALFRYPEGLGLLGLLWTLLVQWVIGSRLEGFWGTARYLIMVLVAGVVGLGGSTALGLVVPAVREATFAGASPIDAAAVVAFAIVFARERMVVRGREISPLLVAGIAGAVVLAFPVLVALAAGSGFAGAWPLLLPSVLAGVVAAVFVQPWRERPNSGKVGRAKPRGPTHLRVVRSADDLLN